MIILDNTTATLEIVLGGAITTNELMYVVSHVDVKASDYSLQDMTVDTGVTTGATEVTAVSAPSALNQRQVKYLSVYQNDTVAATVTVQVNDNTAVRTLVTIIMQAGETLQYDGHWTVIDSTGGIKPAGANMPPSGTDNVVQRRDGATGRELQDSGVVIDDSDAVTGVTDFTMTGTQTVTGVENIFHTATENDDHALEVVTDAAGFGDVRAVEIEYITGGVSAGEAEAVILINVDEQDATGGTVAGLEVLSTEVGSAEIHALEVGAGIYPVYQSAGTFTSPDTAEYNTVSKLTEFTTSDPGGANNIDIFENDNDTIEIGDAAQFSEIEVILETVASGVGIKPTFEYSTGAGTWATFSPVDGTDGFRFSGIIAWELNDIGAWAPGDGTKYLIRITRTQNTLSTVPKEDLFQIANTTPYTWDHNGDLVVRNLQGIIGATTPAAITGTVITANTGFMPDADDGAYLGQSGTAFSDLFLASGGTINFGGGSAVVTGEGGQIALRLGGTFTSGGVGTTAYALTIATDITGAAGDTTEQALFAAGTGVGGSVTTGGNTEVINRISTMALTHPNITLGTGDTVTNASTLYIQNAPTEGTNNYAIFVDSGDVRFDGDLFLPSGGIIDFNSNVRLVHGASLLNIEAVTLSQVATAPVFKIDGTGVTSSTLVWRTNSTDRWTSTVGSGLTTLVFNDSSANDVLVLEQGGNVGIGTSGPVQQLEINSGVEGAPDTSGTAQDGGLRVGAVSLTGVALDMGVDGTGTYTWLQSRNVTDYSVNYDLALNPNGGSVGIGTNSPGSPLHVSGPLGNAFLAEFTGTRSDTDENVFKVQRDSDTTGDVLRLISHVEAGGTTSYTAIVSEIDDATAASIDGSLSFRTAIADSLTEALKLTSTQDVEIPNGNLYVGVSSGDGLAHFHDGSAGAVTAGAGSETGVFESNGSTGVSFLAPDANNVRLTYGGPSDADWFQLLGNYNSGSPYIALMNSASERFRFTLDSTPVLYINDTGNGNMTTGLTINQGSAGDEAFALKSTDVAHGITGVAETDTYFWVLKRGAANGGAILRAATDTSGQNAMLLQGIDGGTPDTTDGASGYGVVEIRATQKSGTGVTSIADAGNLFNVNNSGNARLLLKGNGDLQMIGTPTLYINETDNANMATGLTINQGTADDEILAFKSSDISHSQTGSTEADTYATFGKISASLGGLEIRGFVDDITGGSRSGISLDVGNFTITGATTAIRAVNIPTIDITAGPTPQTVTDASTLYIPGAPTASGAGPATITNAYALFVDGGIARFDGDGTDVFELPADATDPTSGGGAATGRIPVKIGGATVYIPYY